MVHLCWLPEYLVVLYKEWCTFVILFFSWIRINSLRNYVIRSTFRVNANFNTFSCIKLCVDFEKNGPPLWKWHLDLVIVVSKSRADIKTFNNFFLKIQSIYTFLESPNDSKHFKNLYHYHKFSRFRVIKHQSWSRDQ